MELISTLAGLKYQVNGVVAPLYTDIILTRLSEQACGPLASIQFSRGIDRSKADPS
jgi:hypothetical protein